MALLQVLIDVKTNFFSYVGQYLMKTRFNSALGPKKTVSFISRPDALETKMLNFAFQLSDFGFAQTQMTI